MRWVGYVAYVVGPSYAFKSLAW